MASPPTTLPFSAAQLRALLTTIGKFSNGAREQGRRLYDDSRVTSVSAPMPFVQAEVRDAKTFAVLWEPSAGSDWRNECSCPTAVDCKHAYAVARRIVDLCSPDVIAEVRRGAGLSTLASAASVTAAATKASATPRALRLNSLFPKGQSLADRQVSLRYLLANAGMREVDPYAPALADALAESDLDLMLWSLAESLVTLSGGALPPELEPYRVRPDLAEARTERRREALKRELRRWAQKTEGAAQKALRFLWTLVPGPTGRVQLACEARLSSSRLRNELRTPTQLRQLRNDAQVSAGLLSSPQQALLDIYLGALEGSANPYVAGASNDVLLAMLRVDAAPLSMVWGEEIAPELAARAGATAGEPLAFDPQPVTVLPTATTHDDAIRIELSCQWSDGASRLCTDVLYLDDASDRNRGSLVLADGKFYSVVQEPPLEVRSRFFELVHLDVEKTEGVGLLRDLAPRFNSIRETLASRTRTHHVAPLVALDLRDDDWLQMRLFAPPADSGWRPGATLPNGAVVFEYEPDEQWRPLHREGASVPGLAVMATEGGDEAAGLQPAGEEKTEAAAPEVETECWVDLPDPDDTAPPLGWLEAVGARPGARRNRAGYQTRATDRDVGWWLELTPKRMATFAEVWDERPAHLQFFGTDRVRRLFSGTRRVRAKIRVRKSGVDWFAVSADWEAEGLQLSEEDLAKLRASNERFVRLASGWVQRDEVEEHDEVAALLADLGIAVGDDEQRLTVWQLAGARPETLAALEELGGDTEAATALAHLRTQLASFQGVPEVAVPPGVTAELRPYQKQGLEFLTYGSTLGIGSVLADDMGLGKTIQALAWLEHLRTQDESGGPSLVVCPTSVMHNWAREAARFVPGMRVLLLEAGEERHQLRKEIESYDLAITNYALLRRDIDEWKEIALRAAILDEAQNIKNPDAVVSRAAFELQAKHRVALTGTPLENRPLDLWSILNFVNPGYLGSRSQFSSRFDRLDAPGHSRTLLAAKLRPVLLRRMKKEVARDLPDRIEERRDCELTEGQRQLYLAELRRSRQLIADLGEGPEAVGRNQISILAALTRLRQICCHPVLAGGTADLGSGKLDTLFELLEPLIEEGHKVLLFSQFVQCLDLIRGELETRGIAHYQLTGQTSKRDELVQRFHADEGAAVFLISLKAGGTGLNLTSASYVILFDPWWNPAVEAQAIDRAHRIGQDQTVIAYRLVTRGTIEEKIFALQQRKASMVQDILGEDGFARVLTRDDLDYLLTDLDSESEEPIAALPVPSQPGE